MAIKIQTVLNISQSYFDEGIFRKYISSSKNGSLILFHDYLGDMLLANTDDQNYQVKPIYGDSSPHQNQIVSISSPQLNQIITTVDSQGCIKVWKIFERYKSLIFNYKPKNRPINVKMHPSGLLLAANFGHQIKIYGIVSEQFEQLAAIKTNDFCSSITFSGITQFLISNQKSFIKLYEPFTLQCHHRIEPQDLKLQIKSFKVSQNGEFIVYQCCNKKVYMYTLSNFAKKQQIIIREQVNEKDESNKNSSLFCHHQSQIYNCFYFDFGKSKDFQTYQKQKNLDFLKSQRDTGPNYKSMYRKNINQDKANMFVGFTQNKYMVLYGNYGQRLIAQFSIQECFVTDLYQDKNLLFVGTNKGTIRTYDWPIFEEFLQMRIYEDDNAQKKARIIAPQYKQFCVWKDKSPITCLHKLSEQNNLIVGNKHGCLGLINFCYNRSQREKYPTSHNLNIKLDNCLSKNSQKDHQRIKLGQTMCSLKYIKLTQQQRINKLIQKTQNDIIKLQYQINREKNQKMLQLQKEKKQQQQNFQRKAQQQNQQYSLYCSQQNRQIRKLKQQYQKKKKSLKEYLQNSQKISSQKICYEQNRLNDIKNEQIDQRNRYRKMIKDVADRHKVDIQNMKKQYWNKIKILQNQLQQFIQKQLSNNHVQVVPFQLKQHKTANLPPSVYESMLRVEQLAHQLQNLQNKLECLQKSHKNFGEEDSTLQKQFQQALEKYNKGRFQILNLHSEVLKMQNQLLERKQILEKKDSVISVIKYEKQVNQTYKVFAKGGIIGVQKAKEIAYIQYLKKQDQLKSLFKELQSEIYRGQQQKVKISNDKMMIRILQKQVKQKNVAIQNLRQKLDGLKKVLLLQGLGESAQQKQVYHEQQKLLVAIKWLEKRFKMTCINQKKLINLKQQGVAQIIKQNKHLLQQCNQLREQGIQYQNQINHLSQKLAQANKIIDLEKKVSTQKGDINKQTMKLQQIRKIFSKQLHMLSNEDPELSAIL